MGGDRYRINNQNDVYFLTITVVDWIDLFTRKEYSIIVVDSSAGASLQLVPCLNLYIYSNFRSYAGQKGLLEIELL